MVSDPFQRGPYPVGVCSGQVVDPARGDRRLPFEAWYPADAHYSGQDTDLATQDTFIVLADEPALRQAAVRDARARAGSYPLVLFSHTSAGHRRQSSFLCTHLASHGYIVAAADHLGNTYMDLVERRAARLTRTDKELDAYVQQIISDRVPDLRYLLAALLDDSASELAGFINEQQLGLIGWSFGGWAVLAALEVDDRFRSVIALVPGGSSNPLPGIIPSTLTFAWKRAVPTLYLAAELDQYIPPSRVIELYERTPAPKQLFILRDAGHDHFGDHFEATRCKPAQAQLFTRGLTLAHLDATLKGEAGARRFLDEDPVAALRRQGVNALRYEVTA
jgi:predicted dienelactone hydrolase